MTRIIAEPCVDVKSGECVDVCPVDCIHPYEGEEGYDDEDMLYINPNECIDCGACEPVCPVEAIFPSPEEVPEEWRVEYVKRNYEYFDLESPM